MEWIKNKNWQTLRRELDAMESAMEVSSKPDYDMEALVHSLKKGLAQIQSSTARLQGEVESMSVELEKEAELAAAANSSKKSKKGRKWRCWNMIMLASI